MPLSTWAIRNPILPIILFILLSIAGLFAFMKLPVNNMPNVVVPFIHVMIVEPGATPTEIESQITKRVESALSNLSGVKHISSTISEGGSATMVEFHLGTSTDRAFNDTRDAINMIRSELPANTQEPIVQRFEIDSAPTLIYSVEAPELRPEDLSWYVDDTVHRELSALPGVGNVHRHGGIGQAVTLTLDPMKLASLGVSAGQLSRQLARTHLDLPAGKVTIAGTEYALRTLGNMPSIEALKQMPIALSQGTVVKLEDIGTITETEVEPKSITRLNGKPVVTFQVFRTKGASEVDVASVVEAKLADLEKQNKKIHFKQIFSMAKFTKTTFKSTLYTFIEGCALTILVVFCFLRDKRATLIAAITIPLSILPTFLCLYALGFTLNAISLLAISLVTGVLVDDAIVEIENIHRYMRAGKNPYEAAMLASEEIGLAVVATTLVICAVFVPVSFMAGVIGQFFKQFGLTVAIAAFFSLMVARLLTPMLAAFFLKAPKHTGTLKSSRWKDYYIALVTWTLNNRFKTVVIALVSMVLSFSVLPFLSSGFIPYEDYSESRLSLQLPKGTPFEQTDRQTQKVASMLRNYKEVEDILTNTYANESDFQIKLVPPKDRNLDQRAFENKVLADLKKLPDMRISFTNLGGQKDVSITLVSDDGESLVKTAEIIASQMADLSGLSGVTTSANLKQPEIIIRPDFGKAAQLGVSVQEMSDVLNIATLGDSEINLSKFNYGSRQVPIFVRFSRKAHDNIALIENIMLPTAGGDSVPLSAVATIEYGSGPSTIERFDRHRKIALEANLNGLALGEALKQIYALPAMKNLPPQVKIENVGDAEMMMKLCKEFLQALAAGLLMVYFIQVLLYKNWIQPLVRMAALPLSIGGTFLLLLFTGTEISMPVAIGILMLMGIADKNSILLVDCMLDLIKQGVPKNEAIIQACAIRSRPIIMTSLAMLAGMMPIALGLGMDTAFRAPMAIAVIGGLTSSTALSLIFVPVFFSYVRDFEAYMSRKWLSDRKYQVVTNEG